MAALQEMYNHFQKILAERSAVKYCNIKLSQDEMREWVKDVDAISDRIQSLEEQTVKKEDDVPY